MDIWPGAKNSSGWAGLAWIGGGGFSSCIVAWTCGQGCVIRNYY